MDMTIVIGPHKFILQAPIDHHGPSMYSDHYTTSSNCCKKINNIKHILLQWQHKLQFKMNDAKNSSTAFVAIYNMIMQL